MTLCVDISPHCSALFGTRLLSMHFHDIALISCCGLRRECAAALFSDTGSTQNPPCLSLSKSKYPGVANIFIQILNISFSVLLRSFPFPLFPFCATLNSDAASAKLSQATIFRFARNSLRNHHSIKFSLRNHYALDP